MNADGETWMDVCFHDHVKNQIYAPYPYVWHSVDIWNSVGNLLERYKRLKKRFPDLSLKHNPVTAIYVLGNRHVPRLLNLAKVLKKFIRKTLPVTIQQKKRK